MRPADDQCALPMSTANARGHDLGHEHVTSLATRTAALSHNAERMSATTRDGANANSGAKQKRRPWSKRQMDGELYRIAALDEEQLERSNA
jgi:hypothetical protein